MTWLRDYWSWVGGNIGAMPLQAVITVVATLLLRRHVARWWHHLVGERADIEDVKRMAESARRIAADLFERNTGERHPDSPDTESEG